MNFILGILTMCFVVFIFGKIRGFIFNRVFNQLKRNYNRVAKLDIKTSTKNLLKQRKEDKEMEFVLNNISLNASIGKTYKKGKESFSWEKFKKIFYLGSLVEWVKSLKELGILDLRKWVIIGVIIGGVYGYAYFQGRLNAPVQVNMSYDKAWVMNLNGEEIYKPKFSNDVFIRDSKTKEILKQIKAKDMGLLRKKLQPISFQLKPIFVAGGGVGAEGLSGELGAGISWLRMWQYRIDTFLTQKGIYIGTSYKLKSLENSAIGVGIGKGFQKLDNRVIFYWRFNF